MSYTQTSRLSRFARLVGACEIALALTGFIAAPSASAEPADCTETMVLYDPHDLVSDADLPVDLGTLIEVEGLVDDYSARIDDAIDAEDEGEEPPDGEASEDLIDEARWEISDAIDLGRSIAGCDEF